MASQYVIGSRQHDYVSKVITQSQYPETIDIWIKMRHRNSYTYMSFMIKWKAGECMEFCTLNMNKNSMNCLEFFSEKSVVFVILQ